jgi:hypothetical protein
LKKKNGYRVLVGKPEENRLIGMPINRLKDNIKMDFKKSGLGDMDWTDLAKHRDKWVALLTTVMKILVS